MSAQVGFAQATSLVANREIAVKLRDRSFIISIVVTLVFIAAAFVVPAWLQSRTTTYTVVTVGPLAQQVVAETGAAAAADVADGEVDPFEFEVETTGVATVADAERQVSAGDADVAVLPSDGGVELLGERDVPSEFRAAVAQVLTQRRLSDELSGLGAAPDQVADLLQPASTAQRLLAAESGDPVTAVVLGIAFAVVFFLTAQTFGVTIAQSVTEEKQNRVVELLVAAVPVRALLVGKVLGNLALALGQIVLLIAVGLLAASVAGRADAVLLLANSAGWFVAFFLTGFTMLSCLWAAAGALASRLEDLASTTLPMQLIVTLPFFAAITVTDEGPARTALSYIPLSAPITMPQRLVAGDAQWWEGLISLVVIAVTATIFILLADRLYRGSLLRTGGKTTLKQAWAAAD